MNLSELAKGHRAFTRMERRRDRGQDYTPIKLTPAQKAAADAEWAAMKTPQIGRVILSPEAKACADAEWSAL